MPEGDTVWRTAQRLHDALAGSPIVLCDLRWGDLATADLTGASTTEVVSRGKHILHRTSTGLTLHSHLRMEGQWRIEHPGVATERALRRRDLRAALGTTRWTALGLRLGMLDLVPTAQESSVVGHLGPDILGGGWDPAPVLDRLCAEDRFVVDCLLDQRVLAGVGTFWASEGLFVQRLHPWTRGADLTRAAGEALLASIRTLMVRATGHAIQSSTGSYRLGEQAYVHGRSGRPCRRCGDTVRVAMTGSAPTQRTIFSCPTCQGGLAPTDDGRPQRPLGSGRGDAHR